MIQSIVAGVVLILGLAVAGIIRDKLNDYTPPIILAITATTLAVVRSFATDTWAIQHMPLWGGLLIFLGMTAVIAIALINRGVTDFNDAFAAGLVTFAVAFPFAAHWWLPTGIVMLLIAWLNRQNEGSRPAVTATISMTRRVSGIAGSFLLLTGTSVNVLGWTGFFLSAMLTLLIVMWKVAKAWYSKLGAVVTAVLCGLVFFTSNPLQSLKHTVDSAAGGNAGGSSNSYPKVKTQERSFKVSGQNPVGVDLIPMQSEKAMDPETAVDKLGHPFGNIHEPALSLKEFNTNFGSDKDVADCSAKWLANTHAGDNQVVRPSDGFLQPMVVRVAPAPNGGSDKIADELAKKMQAEGNLDHAPIVVDAPYLVTFKKVSGGCKPVIDVSNRVMAAYGYAPQGDTTRAKGFDAFTGAPWFILSNVERIGGAIAD